MKLSLKIFRGMKSKNPHTISISSKSSMESQLNDIKFCNTSWYRNSISAFQKKKLKAIKKTQTTHQKTPLPLTQTNIYFSVLSLGNWSTFLRIIRTHWLLFSVQTSLITPSGWYQNILTSVRGSFSSGLRNTGCTCSAAPFQSSK